MCRAVTQQVNLSEAAKVTMHAVFQKIESGQLPDLGFNPSADPADPAQAARYSFDTIP